jgi:hypothetical protein
MTSRYVCVRCDGEKCLRCGGRGWITEAIVQREQKDMLTEVVAKNLVEKRIAQVGPEEWAKKAAEKNPTVDQFTEVEIWQATGPISYEFMSLTDDVVDALANLIGGIDIPPVFIEDRPELRVIG